MERVIIGKEVTINGVYFKNKQGIEAYPKQMEFDGETYTFLNDGWRYLVHKGKEVIRIFNVTDGEMEYRIKLEPTQNKWTLLDMTPSQYTSR